jgi:hypothetical protein
MSPEELMLQNPDRMPRGFWKTPVAVARPEMVDIEARRKACELLVKQGHARWFEKGKTRYWPRIELIHVG